MFTNHNPSRVIIYKAAEHYKNITKARDVLFDGNTDNWQAFEDHLTKESVNSTIGLPCYQPARDIHRPPLPHTHDCWTSRRHQRHKRRGSKQPRHKTLQTQSPKKQNSATASLTVLVITLKNRSPWTQATVMDAFTSA
jgi:hypothetical protein